MLTEVVRFHKPPGIHLAPNCIMADLFLKVDVAVFLGLDVTVLDWMLVFLGLNVSVSKAECGSIKLDVAITPDFHNFLRKSSFFLLLLWSYLFLYWVFLRRFQRALVREVAYYSDTHAHTHTQTCKNM